jgi:two-component system NarL family sensor kinase
VAALQARLDAVETRGGTRADMTVDGIHVPDQLPRVVEEELYHIAQEGLNNVLKHAHAEHIHVHLNFSDTQTLLEICDDGVGFALDSMGSAGGLGLTSLRERAQMIGARLDIESVSGGGTKVKVTVPAVSAMRKHAAERGT